MKGLKALVQNSCCDNIAIFRIIDYDRSQFPVVSTSMEKDIAEYLAQLVEQDQQKQNGENDEEF